MSDEAKTTEPTEVKKKKGKMPVVIALLVLLGGGGFFGMKMKSGGPKKVVVKAGTVEQMDKEFLVNLASGANVYLRAEVALELRDGYKKEDLDANIQAIRDRINQIFRSKSLQEVSASETDNLRKEIAESVNAILVDHMKDEEKKAQAEFEKAAAESQPPDKKDNGKKGDQSKAKSPPDDKGKAPSDDKAKWVCPAGPVLNVYFTSFTTQ